MGRLFYLLGKSACGKDSIYTELLRNLPLSPFSLYTTRPMRDNETEGVEYHFTSRAQFEAFQEAGKVIESRTYQTVHGPWTYYTVDDGTLRLDTEEDRLGIGTLESYLQLLKYYGPGLIVPLYIEVDDGIRLERALKRERTQEQPHYQEMCRRYLADDADFSEERLQEAGITKRFENLDFETCRQEIFDYVRSFQKGTASYNGNA